MGMEIIENITPFINVAILSISIIACLQAIISGKYYQIIGILLCMILLLGLMATPDSLPKLGEKMVLGIIKSLEKGGIK